MTAKLQEAINATRNGNTVEAQKLLADILKADTENVQAWYLLSLLVDSPEKKQAYLNRVLALDPMHEKAQEALASFYSEQSAPPPVVQAEPPTPTVDLMEETAVSPPIFEDPSDFQQDTDSTLPSWLDEDNSPVAEELLVEEDPSEIFVNSELPDWLTNETSHVDIQDEPPTLHSDSPPRELEEMLNEKNETAVSPDPLDEDMGATVQLTPHIETADSTAKIRPWNIALTILSIAAILTMITLLLQLFKLF